MKDLCSIGGVIPAMMTCFDANGGFDELRQRALTEFLIGKKVNGLYLTGSTGEAFLMDGEERMRVVDTVLDQTRGRVPVIVHVGDMGTRKSIRLAEHAWKAGADALSSVPPFYFRFTEGEIVSYYRALSAATPLPMIVYNISLAGAVSSDTMLKLAALPGVRGMKYTLSTHHEILRLKDELGPDFRIYSGCDEMALSGLLFGADGIIGSFYNVIPEVFLALADAVRVGDMERARACQRAADAIVLFVLRFPYFDALKRMLYWIGLDAGHVREPFSGLTLQEERELLAGLHNIRDRFGTFGIEAMEKLPESLP